MTPTTKRALERASEHFGRPITLNTLRNPTKAYEYCRPRFFVAAYLRSIRRLRYEGSRLRALSYPQIRDLFRLRDHTTIISGERKAKDLWPEIDFDKLVQEDFGPLWQMERLLKEGRDNMLTWRWLNGAGWVEEAA